MTRGERYCCRLRPLPFSESGFRLKKCTWCRGIQLPVLGYYVLTVLCTILVCCTYEVVGYPGILLYVPGMAFLPGCMVGLFSSVLLCVVSLRLVVSCLVACPCLSSHRRIPSPTPSQKPLHSPLASLYLLSEIRARGIFTRKSKHKNPTPIPTPTNTNIYECRASLLFVCTVRTPRA